MKFYEFVRIILRGMFHTIRRVSVYDVENVPAEGAVLLAPNHLGLLDPFMVSYRLKRKPYWMAKKELFKVGIVRKFITYMGGFPVDRGKKDTNQARMMFKLIKEGNPIGIFPEGTRVKKNKPKPRAKTGVIKYAVETNIPIVPVAIWGKPHFFGKMYVRFGEPRYIPKKENGEAYTREELQEKADELLKEIYSIREIPV